MSYIVNYTDTANHTPITVNDNVTNTSTNLGFPGRNQKGYAQVIAENFLHLLENFARSTSPGTIPGEGQPVAGQLWFDTTDKVKELKIYDGTSWKAAGSLKKGTSEPAVSNSIVGDVWVDTSNQQLYLFNGAKWILVGPTFSSGLLTGVVPDKIPDSTSNQTDHVILLNHVDDNVITIASGTTFTPKSGITGFSTIKPGINLSSNSSYKYWGTSEKAENLIDGTTVIPASSFLRKDTNNTTTQSLSVKNDSGLLIGGESQLQINITEGRGVIYHSRAASKLDLRVNYGLSNTQATLISLDATSGRVGVGLDNVTPASLEAVGTAFSVKGTSSFSDTVRITSTTETQDASSGALIVSGGAVFSKTILVENEITANGQINSSSIVPTSTNNFAIGSPDFKFLKTYSKDFYGDLTGNVTGNVNGDVTGSASSLKSLSTFKITGDMLSSGFSFNGSATLITSGSFVVGQVYTISVLGNTNWNAVIGTTGVTYNVGDVFTARNTGTSGTGAGKAWTSTNYEFSTTINQDFINSKDNVTALLDTDEILINRPDLPGGGIKGIYKTTKANLMANLPFVPVGSIFPFAGPTPPPGYLLCDGSEKLIGTYQVLFDTIGYSYTSGTIVGKNTFKIPDLRGRFPLGLDNMDNADTVPDKNLQIVNAGLLITGQQYKIEFVGSTNFMAIGASENTVGIVFTATGPGDGTGYVSKTSINQIDSGGGPAGRVTDDTASTLGNAAGRDKVTIGTSQIPQHSHKLTGSTGTQYYVTNNQTIVPGDTNSSLMDGPTTSSSTRNQHLSTTGSINTNDIVGQPVTVMNPYLAINYIIYSGVIKQ